MRARKLVDNKSAKRIYSVFIEEGLAAAKVLNRQLGFKQSTFYSIISTNGFRSEKFCHPTRKKNILLKNWVL